MSQGKMWPLLKKNHTHPLIPQPVDAGKEHHTHTPLSTLSSSFNTQNEVHILLDLPNSVLFLLQTHGKYGSSVCLSDMLWY